MLNLAARPKINFRSVLITVFITATLWANGQLERARKDLDAAFHAGQPFILVITGGKPKPADDNETYADWAEYLNAFRAQTDSRIKIVKVTALQYPELIIEPKPKDKYATLFVRDSEHGLLYDGMILEPQVYQLGLAYLQDHPDGKANLANGLKDVSVRRRQAK
jgi:hypothetical protein